MDKEFNGADADYVTILEAALEGLQVTKVRENLDISDKETSRLIKKLHVFLDSDLDGEEEDLDGEDEKDESEDKWG